MNPRATVATLIHIGVATRVAAYSFSATATNHITFLWRVPESWSGGTVAIKLYYANGGTSTANMRWKTLLIKDIVLNTDLSSTISEVITSDIVTPSATQYALRIHQMSVGFTPTAVGDLVNVLVMRNATDAEDTNTSVMLLVGVGLVYNSKI
jgi:hypothetical protein